MSLEKPNCSVESLERLAYQAMLNGGRSEGSRYVEWDIGGNCRNKQRVNRYSRASELASSIREDREYVNATAVNPGYWRQKGARIGMEVTLLTKCRTKCPVCLAERAALWRGRAISECEAASRNWFGTLTLRPEEHYRLDAIARAGIRHPSDKFWIREPMFNWHDLTDDARAAERMQAVGRELTLWLKRVRKNSGVPFRYLAVTEIHDGSKRSQIKDRELRSHCVTGHPHIHILMHEVDAGRPLLKKFLSGRWSDRKSDWETPPSWKLGFTKFKLLDDVQDRKKGAMYLCKYLSKAMLARVRPSIDYGGVTGPEGYDYGLDQNET